MENTGDIKRRELMDLISDIRWNKRKYVSLGQHIHSNRRGKTRGKKCIFRRWKTDFQGLKKV